MEKGIAQIQFNSADGKSMNLAQYSGKVVLIVNVASKCGLTPQYDGLEKLFENYREKGLVVLGFPANEFKGQEPGTNAEIQEFCRMTYGVQFPVLEKIIVKGEGQHPLYKYLTEAKPAATKKAGGLLEAKLAENGLLGGKPNDIMWNFEKFLVSRQGKVIARFAPDIAPDETVLIKAIETELAN